MGIRLDESFGLMHAYDVDLSLQYIEAGFRVNVAAVEIEHLADIRVFPKELKRLLAGNRSAKSITKWLSIFYERNEPSSANNERFQR